MSSNKEKVNIKVTSMSEWPNRTLTQKRVALIYYQVNNLEENSSSYSRAHQTKL